LADDNSAAIARAQLAELNTELANARTAYAELEHKANTALYKDLQEQRQQLADAEKRLADANSALSRAKQRLETIEAERAEILTAHRRLREEHAQVQAEAFNGTATVCDKCGQLLPSDQVNAMLEAFNVRKSERLESLTRQMDALVKRGEQEASKDMLAAAAQAVPSASNAVATEQAEFDRIANLLANTERKLQSAKLPAFETTNEYKAITDRITAVKSAETESAPDTSTIDGKIAYLRRDEQEMTAARAAFETEAAQKSRIADLEKQEKHLGEAYAEMERALYLCEKFSRVKSALLTDRINEKFTTVRFQLFRKNITNDGIEDVCEVLVPTIGGDLIPFDKANNAARVNAGFEIIQILGEHYGAQLPVFFDNAESVTEDNLKAVKFQLIRTLVSKPDKTLRLVAR
jgi:DNA repair exonuclease SbcCD ATPase subunit